MLPRIFRQNSIDNFFDDFAFDAPFGIAHRDADYYEKKYGELDRPSLSGISEDGDSTYTDSDADKDIRDLSNIPGIVHEDEGGEGNV